MIITISGKPGSGKTTVAKILAKKLGWKEYYMGAIRREMARKKGMTLDEYNKLGEKDPSTDMEVDKYQEKLGKKDDNFIIQGRTSFLFIPHSFKVYFDVDFDEGAKRIWEENKMVKRNEGHIKTLAGLKKSLQRRIQSDKKRYKKYYNINCYDRKHYDLIIDTTKLEPKQVANLILKEIGSDKFK